MPGPQKLFVIDGHSQLYKAYHAIAPLSNRRGEPTNAVYGFMQIFHRIRKTYSPDHLAVVFDPPGGSFRNELLESYKANRPEPPADLVVQIGMLKELLLAMKVPVFEVSGFEADDTLACLARWAVRNGGEACVVSVDKDMLQVVEPGITILREHLGKIEVLDSQGVKDKLGVTPEQVPTYLGLLGDASDNIPGVPGVGKKRAADLLSEFGTLEAILAEAEGKTKPKFWASLAENAELAVKSRELATIRDDVPIGDVSWGSLAWKLEPTPELRERLADLEFRAMLEELGGATVEERTTDYGTVLTKAELDEVAKRIASADLVAIDTETTGFDPFREQLIGISLSWDKNQAVYIPLPGCGAECLDAESVRAALSPLFKQPSIRWIAHNWRFDYKFLLRAGYDVGAVAVDTLVAAYLLNPEGSGFGLKALALDRLGVQMTTYNEVSGGGGSLAGDDDLVSLATVDIERVSEYACQDADLTRQLAVYFLPQLEEAKLDTLYREIEVPLVDVLARMEIEGVRIDRRYFKELSKEITDRLTKLTHEIHEMAGRPFNINSTQQLAEILFNERGLTPTKKTKSGYSTDVTVLEALAGEDPFPARLLDYRQLEKLRSTYVDALPLLINPVTGRIHTTFLQTVAATGRLSSREPNLQNIPVRTEAGRQIRRGFVPREEGWVFLAADYSQIELRILAHMSRDEALIEAFRTGADIHTLTASKVFGMPASEVDKAQRSSAKAINFGIVYGMTAFRLARDLGISPKEAQGFIDEYFNAYQGVAAFIEHTLEQCRRDGFVRTMMGRRRHVADINSANRNVRSGAERVAVNTPIQGTSADMIKIAMLRIDERIRREGLRGRMVLQVHDELIFDLPGDEVEAFRALVGEEMRGAMELDVPVVVDMETGANWAEV